MGALLGGLIGVIVFRCIAAKRFEAIATAKGYYKPEVNAFAICFWLGTAGWLYIMALPNKKLDVIQLNQQKKIIEFLESINNNLNGIKANVEEVSEEE